MRVAELRARVIAAASSRPKLALATVHGADATIDYATEDLKERAKALTGGKGVDVVFDPPWDQNMMSEAARLALGTF